MRKILYLIISTGVLFFLLNRFAGPSVSSAADKTNQVIKLDSRLELFVDHLLIERMVNTRLLLHHPEDKGTVLSYDRSWEGPFCNYNTIIRSEAKYQMYYRGVPTAGKDGRAMETTCYAESADGIEWHKPELELFEVNGTRQNNVILADATPVSHNFSPFLDKNTKANPAHRYKALGGLEYSGLFAYVSADGIKWKKLQEEPVFRQGIFDSQNVSFWSESEQCYLCYFRTWTADKYRTVSRTTSKDFIHWTDPVEMSYGDTPAEHIYINQTAPYFRAPHIYLAIGARLMVGRQVLNEEQAEQLHVYHTYFKDCADVVLMSTRGGNRYHRTFMEAFIPPGIGLQNWVSRSNYPALNVIPTSPNEISVYVNKDYAQPTAHLNRYSLRTDGFISVYAPYAGGEMITRPLSLQGNRLVLNYATSAAGGIRIEIQDQTGKALEGYTLAESNLLIGNEIEGLAGWKQGEDISALSGKPLRLRFVMKDAHLYSLQAQNVPYVSSNNTYFVDSCFVSLTCDRANTAIYYTLDGSSPTRMSGRYSEPFLLKTSARLRMRVFNDTGEPGIEISRQFKKFEFIKPERVEKVEQGIAYDYYSGTFTSVGELDQIKSKTNGIMNRIDLNTGQDDEEFGILYRGFLQVPGDDIYTFYLESNDGSKLYLKDQELIDNDGAHAAIEKSVSVALRAGFYPLKIKYIQMGGDKTLKLSWKSSRHAKKEIETAVLFH